MNTPLDIYNYILRTGKESDFLSAILLQKQGYSIGEIPDAVFEVSESVCRLKSRQYWLDLEIGDEEISAAVRNGSYVTAFLSRQGDNYQLHFLTHPYPAAEKPAFEEPIVREVVRYMILKTVIALRLTTWKKVDEYLAG